MKLVITFNDLHNENDPETLFSTIIEKIKGFSEDELVEFLKELIPQKTEHFPQEHAIHLIEDESKLYEFLDDGEIVVFSAESINYHELMVAVVAMVYFIDEEMKRKKFILDIAHHLNAKDDEIAQRFADDIAKSVYYQFK